jgi:hypothetical protein
MYLGRIEFSSCPQIDGVSSMTESQVLDLRLLILYIDNLGRPIARLRCVQLKKWPTLLLELTRGEGAHVKVRDSRRLPFWNLLTRTSPST